VLALQKNISFSSIHLCLLNGKFLLTIKNDNKQEETFFSEKALKAHRWYHIALRVSQEEGTNFHSISLFVNGYDDLKSQINYFTPFSNSQIVLG